MTPPSSALLFAGASIASGVSLALIFGARQWQALSLLALSCAIGAFARRWLASRDVGAVGQAFSAAFVAGLFGAMAVRLHVSSELRLVAVCACMNLVPGRHILNGAIDVTRLRIPLGAARLVFATLIVMAICAGLLIGLFLGGRRPAAGKSGQGSQPVAGCACCRCSGGFLLRLRVDAAALHILADSNRHACTCSAVVRRDNLGLNAPEGAGVACLVASGITTPLAPRLRLPFAGVTFASVVSLIPGAVHVQIGKRSDGSDTHARRSRDDRRGRHDRRACDHVHDSWSDLAKASVRALATRLSQHLA
jgi:uncharacterized membrane protein YjjB (DUF3815 family)